MVDSFFCCILEYEPIRDVLHFETHKSILDE